MQHFRRHRPALALTGAATASLRPLHHRPRSRQTPAEAPAATIIVTDNRFVSAKDGSTQVTIYAGQTVEFTYPAGTNLHNVDFLALKPASCTQTSGPASSRADPSRVCHRAPAGPAPAASPRRTCTPSSRAAGASWPAA